jgi:hypothetical protein
MTLDFDERCHVTYRRLRVNDERRKLASNASVRTENGEVNGLGHGARDLLRIEPGDL